MSSDTKIVPVKARPVPEVVDALEAALEMARSGELRSIALIGDRPTGNVFYSDWGLENNMRLIGLLTYVRHRLMAQTREESQ